jgi:hypothetical protein
VGRIYAQVRERPRYIVEAVLEESEDALILERRVVQPSPQDVS